MPDSDTWSADLGIEAPLRANGTPRYLFKYLPPSRADVLSGSRIRFTQPLLFNDPFDCLPYFRNLPGGKSRYLRPSDESAESDVISLERYVEEIYDYLDLDPYEDRDVKGAVLRELLMEDVRSMIGVLSVSATPTEPLMWSHYADQHRGIVVGFDTEHEFFQCSAMGERPAEGRFHRVHYVNERPRRRSLATVSAIDGFFTKSQHWSYEREWRQCRRIAAADVCLSNSNGEIALFAFPPAAVKYVLIGMNAANETRALMKRIVLLPVHYRHTVAVFDVTMDPRFYRLRLSSTQWR